MRRIKQNSIDLVLDEASVFDVVSTTEQLKKTGSHWFCKSPFTNEKSASFCVNTVKNTFYDYSAGFGGNAVRFLMKKHPSMTFFEAIEMAAGICGMTLEYEEVSEDQKKMEDELQLMKNLVEHAAEKYQKAYAKLDADSWPKKMIADRKFNEDSVQDFMIGYAPNERSFISTEVINAGKFELSISLGMTNTKDGASHDFFRDRIIFPIHNDRGNIVGFGGRRSNDESQEKYAKYLNSKESKLYQKDRVLYGLWQAKKNIAYSGKAILLEGYTDVISLHQNGVTNCVATCGTSLTDGHAKLLGRYCKHVILFRDGDKAGLRAVHRDIDILLKNGFTVEVVICPAGEDPDSLASKCNILKFIESNRQDAVLWKAKILREESVNPQLESIKASLKEEFDSKANDLRKKIVSDVDIAKEEDNTQRSAHKMLNTRIQKQISDLEKDMKSRISEFPQFEPSLVSKAVESIAFTLHSISNKITQKEYVKHVSKILEQKPIAIEGVIKGIEESEARDKKSKEKEQTADEYINLGLPAGADKDQYLKDRFCEIKNTYWFKKDSGFMVGTNFRIVPLFHVEGRQENKRLCEVINDLGYKRLIDFDSTDLISFTKFKERLIKEGVYLWEPGTVVNDFQLVVKKIANGFIMATELKLLGFQKQGFFAFADGVYHNGEFIRVNKYGVVNIEGLEKTESEYRSDVTHFYSPAYSEIYKMANEGDDPYENDRHFIYKTSPITLDQWMNQMNIVWGDKGKFGIAFVLAANFRDLFLNHYDYFPLFGGFGQKDSGKSGFGTCLQSFFYYELKALELNTSTLVGLSRRLTRCKNTVAFLDEARDDMDEKMHQTMKGGWNGIGREKGQGFEGSRTSVDKINSTFYYAGQYLLTRDDGALASRSIIANFENKEFSSAEKEQYNKLITWNKIGLSSLVLDVIKHRKHVDDNLTKVHAEESKKMKSELSGQEYQNRVFENYIVLVTIVKLFEKIFNFPFTYDEYFKLTKEAIIDNSESIADSDGLAQFWRIIEYLSHPNQRAIKQDEDFAIEKPVSFEFTPKKNERSTYTNSNRDEILFLCFSKVHQDYHKEVSKRQGEEVINANTIRNYLKTKKYFIGLYSSRRIGNKTTSGYAFNYTMMKRLGILTLSDANEAQMSIPEFENLPKKHTIITNPDYVESQIFDKDGN